MVTRRSRKYVPIVVLAFVLVAALAQAETTEVITSAGGAQYGLYAPEPWNGDLVVFVHGYTGPDREPALPPFASSPLGQELLALGYGLAYTSRSETGFAIIDGIQRTRQARNLWIETFAEPDKVYLLGESLGGIMSLALAEKNPGLFDGALPMCSPVGGTRMEVYWLADVRITFDYFFPGVVPGDVFNVPPGLDWQYEVQPAIVGAVLSDFGSAMEMCEVDQVDIRTTVPTEVLFSIVIPLSFNIWETEIGTSTFLDDIFDRTNHHPFFGNMSMYYTGSSDDSALNAAVDRFEDSPAGVNFLRRSYQPHGRLAIPVLTLHNALDPVVPIFHEEAYAAIVADAGRSDMLVQRQVDYFGHCTFTEGEAIAAFQDLVSWVETGVRPTP